MVAATRTATEGLAMSHLIEHMKTTYRRKRDYAERETALRNAFSPSERRDLEVLFMRAGDAELDG